jgi:hypothetical protein
MLRLEADDEDVRTLTALALQDALGIPDPPLRIVCQQCGALLGHGGDTPHGPLFTSTWTVEPPGAVVTVSGHRLPHSAATRWIDEHQPLVERTGAPMRNPVRHGVRALLTPGLADYPDLLVRCAKHGSMVLDRDEVLAWVRQAAHKPVKRKVAVSQPNPDYRPPLHAFGPGRERRQSETRMLPFDTFDSIEEFERWRAENHRPRNTPR